MPNRDGVFVAGLLMVVVGLVVAFAVVVVDPESILYTEQRRWAHAAHAMGIFLAPLMTTAGVTMLAVAISIDPPTQDYTEIEE